MAVDFSFINIVNIISNQIFGGNTTVGGLVIMMVVAFIMMAFLASIKAPMQYALVPMIIMSVIFAALGIMNATVSFLIIIISAVLIAATARRTIGD